MVERIVEQRVSRRWRRSATTLFEELRRMERLEIVNAIGGEGYRTLWPARRA